MWQPGPYTPAPQFKAADVQRRLAAGEIAVLDVREPDEWEAGHIAGAHWVPLGDLEDRVEELDQAQEWVCVCHLGGRSDRAADLLRESGFRAGNLTGGMAAWERQGLPVEMGRSAASP